ncbi:MAG: ABC transporter permease [Longibaculum sp.]
MIIFKNYFKIAKTLLPTILIYTLIFLGIATITSTSGVNQGQSFSSEKSKIALINHDENTPLIDAFYKYIDKHSEYVEIEDSDSALRDALFFRKVDYIMIIPPHFTKQFTLEKNPQIETMEVPDSSLALYSQTLMNKFLNTAQLYLKTGIDEKEMTLAIEKDLEQHVDIEMLNTSFNTNLDNARNFYNFANYTLLAIIISVISMIMISFHEEKIYRRHLVSRYSYQKINRQLLMGNIMTTTAIWLLYVVISFILYRETMFSQGGLLLILNSFIFTIFILILSFFITTLTHNREVVSMISTVLSLGLSFIAGAFVPQELLSPIVLTIAKLTPSYWFISNNNQIAQLAHYSLKDLQPIFINMGVVIGFAVLFYIAIQMTSYWKLKK